MNVENARDNQLFPIFLKLAGRPCTVVGGGEVAARKVRSLLDSGALVHVIAPDLCPDLAALSASGRIDHTERPYQPGDLAGSALAFGATDDRAVNEAVYLEAARGGMPVNVVDQPDLCTFYVPSTLTRGPIQIAISTQGASPALARRLRETLEETIGPEYGRLAALLGELRAEVKAALPSLRDREQAWRRVLDCDALALLAQGRDADARAAARQALGLDVSDSPPRVRIGTRGSALALAQATAVAHLLRQAGLVVEIIKIRTAGDRGAPLGPESTVGLFVREIEQALARGEVDLAVHSMKDLPTGPRPGLAVAAVPPREDPRDAIITRTGCALADLPPGSRVATSSPRRVAQLRARRPDLEFVPVRGNVDTRLRKLQQGDFDALVLAVAGLARLGRADAITERLPFDICLPAPGQGALALQVREDDAHLRALLAQFDHAPTRLAVEAERAFLAAVGSGCSAPAGAVATLDGDRILLTAIIENPQGDLIRDEIAGPADSAADLGAELARRLLATAPDATPVERS